MVRNVAAIAAHKTETSTDAARDEPRI
jgi:hypothetical protein